MNKFKYDEAKNKLVLDIRKPERKDFDYRDLSYLNDYVHEDEYNAAMEKWHSRLSYSLSPQLKAMLTDGQVLGDNEFQVKEPMWGTSASFPVPIAIPLNQEKQSEKKSDMTKDEAIKEILENSNGSWIDMITEGYEAGYSASQASNGLQKACEQSLSYLESFKSEWKEGEDYLSTILKSALNDSQASKPVEGDGWIRVQDGLPQRPEKKTHQDVQCGYFTPKGIFVQFVGFYAEKHKVPFEDFDSDDNEYDPVEEAHGTMFLKEGWYELEETPGGQYDEVYVSREVTHWRHLFAPPQSVNT